MSSLPWFRCSVEEKAIVEYRWWLLANDKAGWKDSYMLGNFTPLSANLTEKNYILKMFLMLFCVLRKFEIGFTS